jgi:hypothetical protein
MNTDEHGWEMYGFISGLVVIALILAVILLYLQDRFRARRGVSSSDHDFAEKKAMAAWQAFLPGILALGSFFNFDAAEHGPRRIAWLASTVLLLWYATTNLMAYFRLKQ